MTGTLTVHGIIVWANGWRQHNLHSEMAALLACAARVEALCDLVMPLEVSASLCDSRASDCVRLQPTYRSSGLPDGRPDCGGGHQPSTVLKMPFQL